VGRKAQVAPGLETHIAHALPTRPQVARQAILSFSQLTALLPRDAAASAAQHALHRLDSRGAEDAAVAAARLFAHSAAHWSQEALHERVPDLLRRWCSHRDFSVREVGASAYCRSTCRQKEHIHASSHP
jgi:hypothetical protein